MRRSVLPLLLIVPTAFAQESAARKGMVEIETGVVSFARNDVAIPGNTGTRFDFRQLTGTGSQGFLRITGVWEGENGPGWRFLYAPLRVSRDGTLDQITNFEGATFAPGAAHGVYRFNSYRATYRNRWKKGPRSDWRVGFTLKVRDAEIAVSQGGVTSRKTDVGVVPLLHVYGEERLSDRWTFNLDLDAAAASQGRAIDAGFRFLYDLNDRSRLLVGWRILEGGADNDKVYNFSLLSYASVGVQFRF